MKVLRFKRVTRKVKKTIFFHTILTIALLLSILIAYSSLIYLGEEYQPPAQEKSAEIGNEIADSILAILDKSIEEVVNFRYQEYFERETSLKKGMYKVKELNQVLLDVDRYKYLAEVEESFQQFERVLAGLNGSIKELRVEYHEVLKKKWAHKGLLFSISRESYGKDVLRVYHKDFVKDSYLLEEVFMELKEDLKLFDFKLVALYKYRPNNKSIRISLRAIDGV